MRLQHLSLTNFRNFARLDVDVPRGVVLLVGSNAQGKTSLLEAVYMLATLTSFHASSERQLISFIAGRERLAVARLVAHFETEERTHRLEVRIIQENSGFNGGQARSGLVRKEVLLDGSKQKVTSIIGKFKAVLFLPQMLSVIDGAPEERRRYLNLALAQVFSNYAGALADYTKALTQRNALLKQLSERGGDAGQLDFWDNLLAEAGAVLLYTRIRAVQELERKATKIHRELTHGDEVLRLRYEMAYDPLERTSKQFDLPIDAPVDRLGFKLEELQKGFKDSLLKLRTEEINRGVTTIGPHRDELRFLSNGVDLSDYGSRGQVRTAMLAMKLAEVEWMKERTGEWPVLLLDEVLAELDSQRRADLLARLARVEQALLTTTDLDLFSPDFVTKTARWNISQGRIQEEIKDAH